MAVWDDTQSLYLVEHSSSSYLMAVTVWLLKLQDDELVEH